MNIPQRLAIQISAAPAFGTRTIRKVLRYQASYFANDALDKKEHDHERVDTFNKGKCKKQQSNKEGQTSGQSVPQETG